MVAGKKNCNLLGYNFVTVNLLLVAKKVDKKKKRAEKKQEMVKNSPNMRYAMSPSLVSLTRTKFEVHKTCP